MKALLTILFIITIQTSYCQDNNVVSVIQTGETNYDGSSFSLYSHKPFLKKTAPWFVQRFTITGGYFAPQSTTDVQVDGSNGSAGTRINFEDDLGLTKTTQAIFGDLQWRISRRSRLDLEGFLINRSAVHTLQEDITFGDITYTKNTTVKSFFNAGTWRLSYGFAVLAKRRYEIGLRVGAHALVNDIGMEVYGSSGYTPGHDFNFTKPLPDGGLWAGFALSQHLALNVEGDYLDASAGSGMKGRILSYNAALAWRVFGPFQVGVGYKGLYFDIDTKDNQNFNGHFKWNTHGPVLTAALAFNTRAWKTSVDEEFPSRKNKELLKKTAPWFVQRFTITGGYFAPQSTTDVQVDGSNGSAGTRINFENDLGLTKTTQAIFGDLQWRISRRSRLDLEGFLINRSAVHTLQEDITFGDITYNKNTTVKSFFNAGTWRLSYGFAVLAKRRYEIGLRVGAHALVNDIGMEVYGSSGYTPGHDFNFTKPLPDGGLWAGFALSQHLALNVEGDYLDASAGSGIKGRILSYNAALAWRVFGPFQVGVGYKGLYFDIDTKDNQNFNGHFKWNTHGPVLTAALAFNTRAWKTSVDEEFPSRKNKELLKKTAPWFVQRFTITGGYFAPQSTTDVQVDGSNGSAGTRINFENDLGLTKTTQAIFGDLQWRISRRSRLDLEGFLINRSAVHTLQEDITFGDITYNKNTTVKSFFNAGTWRLSYGFAVLAKRRYEIGLRVGAHALVNDIGMEVYGSSGYTPGHDFNFTKPLPDGGLWAGFALSQHLALNVEGDYLDASAGSGIKGRILSYNAALAWRVFGPFQVGVGYKGLYFDIDTKDNQNFNGHFKWNTHGPVLTAALAFNTRAWKTRVDEKY